MKIPFVTAIHSQIQRKPLFRVIRLAAMGMAISVAMPVYADDNPAQSPTTHQYYDISAGELSSVLEQFARRAGVNLNYLPKQLMGKVSTGVTGNYGPKEALNNLLQGTGIKAVPNAGGFDLKIESTELQQLDVINVYGRRDDSLYNIPQSVSVREQDYFEARAVNSVGDVIESVPSASRSGSSLDMFSDDFLIRGFSAEQSLNGLGFKRNDHPTDLANVERIEVLKGPASVLFGQMEPGGTVNVVTKQPLDYHQAKASVEYGSSNHVRTTIDVTGPINENIRARLNFAYQDRDASVDRLQYERLFIAPNVVFDLTDTTTLTIEGSYSTNEWKSLHGGTPLEGSILSNPNGQYSKSLNPASSDSTTERDSKSFNLRLVEALTDNLDARLSYSYTRNDADWNEYAPFGLDESDYRTLDRIVFAGTDTYRKDRELIADLSGELETGHLNHDFILGLSYLESDTNRPTQIYSASSIDLYNPQYTQTDLNSAPLIRDRGFAQESEVLAFFVQDRVSFKEDFQVIAGLRYTDSEITQQTTNYLTSTISTDGISQSDWTTQFGLVYDLSDTTSIYANRSESFVPQEGTTSGKVPLEAEEGTQYEIGLRLDLGEMKMNAAGFVIKKENIAIEDPLDDDFEVAQGSARSKGFELSLATQLSPNWYVNAAYGYTDTEILNSDDDEIEGNRFVNVPLHTFSLQTQYQVSSIPGLSIGGTLIHVGDRAGDDENSFTLPSHTRVDLAAYYALSNQVQIDFLVDNVLDEEIFSPGAFDGIVREPERTYMARMKYQF